MVGVVCRWFDFGKFESECLPEDLEFIRIRFRLSDAKEKRVSKFSRVLFKRKEF